MLSGSGSAVGCHGEYSVAVTAWTEIITKVSECWGDDCNDCKSTGSDFKFSPTRFGTSNALPLDFSGRIFCSGNEASVSLLSGLLVDQGHWQSEELTLRFGMEDANGEYDLVFSRRPVQWMVICFVSAVLLPFAPSSFLGFFASSDSNERLSVDVITKEAGFTGSASGSSANSNLLAKAASDFIQSPTMHTREWLIEVNVNSANASELSLLPGVGPVLARRIVSDRLVNGRFERIVDLQRVRGIGPGKLAEIREMAVVDP